MNKPSQREIFDNARRVGDKPEGDGRAIRRRDPRSGQIVETFDDEFREVRIARLHFLEHRFTWERDHDKKL